MFPEGATVLWSCLHSSRNFILLLFLLVFSLLSARKDLNIIANQKKLDVMNNIATALVFLTVIINIFITAFGVQKTGLYPKQ